MKNISLLLLMFLSISLFGSRDTIPDQKPLDVMTQTNWGCKNLDLCIYTQIADKAGTDDTGNNYATGDTILVIGNITLCVPDKVENSATVTTTTSGILPAVDCSKPINFLISENDCFVEHYIADCEAGTWLLIDRDTVQDVCLGRDSTANPDGSITWYQIWEDCSGNLFRKDSFTITGLPACSENQTLITLSDGTWGCIDFNLPNDSTVTVPSGGCTYADPNNPTASEVEACIASYISTNTPTKCPTLISVIGSGTAEDPDWVYYYSCNGETTNIESPASGGSCLGQVEKVTDEDGRSISGVDCYELGLDRTLHASSPSQYNGSGKLGVSHADSHEGDMINITTTHRNVAIGTFAATLQNINQGAGQYSTRASSITRGLFNGIVSSNNSINAGTQFNLLAACNGCELNGNTTSSFMTGKGNLITNASWEIFMSGWLNQASARYGSIGGARNRLGDLSNSATTLYSYVHGESSVAERNYTRAHGRKANAIHQGSHVISDSWNAIIASTRNDQKTERFRGGFKKYTNFASTVGAELPANATAWVSISDKNKKTNNKSLKEKCPEILSWVQRNPIESWQYISDVETEGDVLIDSLTFVTIERLQPVKITKENRKEYKELIKIKAKELGVKEDAISFIEATSKVREELYVKTAQKNGTFPYANRWFFGHYAQAIQEWKEIAGLPEDAIIGYDKLGVDNINLAGINAAVNMCIIEKISNE